MGVTSSYLAAAARGVVYIVDMLFLAWWRGGVSARHVRRETPSGGSIMTKSNTKPKVTVSKSGVLQVSPTEIFKSDVGREAIHRTARLAVLRPPRPAGGGKPKQ